MTISPCISICRKDPETGYCTGCGRSNDDKVKWKDPNTTEEWKIENLKIIKSRLSGWRLERFNEFYFEKINENQRKKHQSKKTL